MKRNLIFFDDVHQRQVCVQCENAKLPAKKWRIKKMSDKWGIDKCKSAKKWNNRRGSNNRNQRAFDRSFNIQTIQLWHDPNLCVCEKERVCVFRYADVCVFERERVCVCVWVFTCVCLHVCICACACVCLSVCLSVCDVLCVYVSDCLCCVSVCLSLCVVCVCVFVCLCMSVCLSLCVVCVYGIIGPSFEFLIEFKA